MMNTPKTDHEVSLIVMDTDDSCVAIYVTRGGKKLEDDLVPASFARGMELRIAELEAKLAKLPHTADDEPVVPGDIVWYYFHGLEYAMKVKEWGNRRGVVSFETRGTRYNLTIDECYSTRAAAAEQANKQ